MFVSIFPQRSGAAIVHPGGYTRAGAGAPILVTHRRAVIDPAAWGAAGSAFDIVPAVADPLAQTVEFDGAGSAGDPTPGPTSAPADAAEDGLAASVADSGRRVIGGRYEVLGLLGSGGMGNVYRARDRELDEPVALKVLRPEIAANAAALERFRREVKLARRVTHPNVARVFDIGARGRGASS